MCCGGRRMGMYGFGYVQHQHLGKFNQQNCLYMFGKCHYIIPLCLHTVVVVVGCWMAGWLAGMAQKKMAQKI
jgi:hypothetical protein